jgi:hypothetical protein
MEVEAVSPQGQHMQERHQDYVWTFPTLPVGQPQLIPFRFDSDADFSLRSLAARIPYDAAGTQTALASVAVAWSGPTQDYRQQLVVPVGVGLVPAGLMLGAYFGQYGNPMPVYPEVRFPANGTTWIQVVNNGPAPLVGLQVFYRGVKLFKPGARSSYTYPAKMRALPYSYPVLVSQLAVTDLRQNQVFRVASNGDFVLRAGQAGRSFAPPTYEVFLTLRDADGYPYSNAPVHVDVLFGQSQGRAAYPVGPVPLLVAPVGPGASQPGLIYPEIYLPQDHVLLYDIARNDGAYVGAVAADFPFNLMGSKVVPA